MSKELEEIRDNKLRIGLLGLKRLVEANKGKISKDEIMAFDFTFMNITKALIKAQENEKILKIIKKKNVDVRILDISPTCEIYNEQVLNCQQLAQEEFDLLKRYFEQ